MKLKQWLSQAAKTLDKADIGSARLDSLILAEDELGRDRGWLLAHLEEKVPSPSLKKLNKKLARRAEHEPMAYIRGFSEFYGRRFRVNRQVLEPRPESETMIELLKQLPISHNSIVIDVGSGSGALAITVKLEVPEIEVVATDIDPACLKIAQKNAKFHKVDIKFLHGDLLDPLLATDYLPNIILANLPYVPTNFHVNQAAAMEPKIAIFGGSDGLDLYRRLFHQLVDLKFKTLFLLTESLPPQHKSLAVLAKKAGFDLYKTQDFIQVFKNTT